MTDRDEMVSSDFGVEDPADLELDAYRKYNDFLQEFIDFNKQLDDNEVFQKELHRVQEHHISSLEEKLTYRTETGESKLADITNTEDLKRLSKTRPVFIESGKPVPEDKKNGLVALNPEDLPFPYHRELDFSMEILCRIRNAFERKIKADLYCLPFYDFPIYTSNLQLLLISDAFPYCTSSFDAIANYIVLIHYMNGGFIKEIDMKDVLLEWVNRKDVLTPEEIVKILELCSVDGVQETDPSKIKNRLVEIIRDCPIVKKDFNLITQIIKDPETPKTSLVYDVYGKPLKDFEEVQHVILQSLDPIANITEELSPEHQKKLVARIKTTTLDYIFNMEMYILRRLGHHIPAIHRSGFVTVKNIPLDEEVSEEVLAKIKENNEKKLKFQFEEYSRNAVPNSKDINNYVDGFPVGIFHIIPLVIKGMIQDFDESVKGLTNNIDKMNMN